MTTELLPKTASDLTVNDLAARLRTAAPTLSDLSSSDLQGIAKAVLFDDLKSELSTKRDLSGIDFDQEVVDWIAIYKSKHTRRNYSQSVRIFKKFMDDRKRDVLQVKYADVDDFLRDLKIRYEARSTRRHMAALGKLYSTLERRTDGRVKNNFRRIPDLPKVEKKQKDLPAENDILMLQELATGTLKAAIILMSELGLRVGALPTLKIRAGKYTAYSKGKYINGQVSDDLQKRLKKIVDLQAPFHGETAPRITGRFRYLQKKHGLKVYGPHTLRHAFAVRLYRNTKDVYAVSKALNHAGIAVTETYLRGLGEL
jgi:integrase